MYGTFSTAAKDQQLTRSGPAAVMKYRGLQPALLTGPPGEASPDNLVAAAGLLPHH